MTRLLLDTHTFIWWDNGKLSRRVTALIQDAEEVYVSAATVWEMAIKASLGKLTIKAEVAPAIADNGFLPLPIAVAHADRVRTLPFFHRDPFDRLLVAQAGMEALGLVSSDPKLRPYDVELVWA
jgi:PIN domain nuclease of toxin-antitoxin system